MSKKYKPNNLEKIQMLFQDIGGMNAFHDAVYDATHISYTDDELEKLFAKLPTSIQEIAFEWTLSDTEFRELTIQFFKTAELAINIRRSRESLIQR